MFQYLLYNLTFCSALGKKKKKKKIKEQMKEKNQLNNYIIYKNTKI